MGGNGPFGPPATLLRFLYWVRGRNGKRPFAMDANPFPVRWKPRARVRAVRRAGPDAGTGSGRTMGAGPAGLGAPTHHPERTFIRCHCRQRRWPGSETASTGLGCAQAHPRSSAGMARCTSGMDRIQHSRWQVPLSSGLETVQLRLQFPDPPLCLQSSLPFRLGDALHCGQVHDGPAGLGVVPLQLSPLPAQVQLQHFAVALQTAVGQLHNFDRLVAVSDPPRAVARAGLVEAPVLRDSQGIVGGFIADV